MFSMYACHCQVAARASCVCQTLVPRDFSSVQTMTENAGAPGMHDLAWCNEAPVMHQDMVEGRFSHVPARTAP